MSHASLGAIVGVLVFGIANGLMLEAIVVSSAIFGADCVRWGLSRLFNERNYRGRYER